jgi:aldehyde:ferredoxin oxidoreductase
MWKLQPYVVLFLFFAAQQVGSKKGKETLKDVVMDVDDLKEFKKLLRTRTNVLAMFAKNGDEMADMMPIFSEVATIMKGKATLVAIDCRSVCLSVVLLN